MGIILLFFLILGPSLWNPNLRLNVFSFHILDPSFTNLDQRLNPFFFSILGLIF